MGLKGWSWEQLGEQKLQGQGRDGNKKREKGEEVRHRGGANKTVFGGFKSTHNKKYIFLMTRTSGGVTKDEGRVTSYTSKEIKTEKG